MTLRCFIGWDADQLMSYVVSDASLRAHASIGLDIRRIALSELQAIGLYRRPTRRQDGVLYDEISEAPMATGHAIARFLVPALCEYEGLALFTDGDVLVREDIAQLVAQADPEKAVQVVQHDYQPTARVKMVGQVQSSYPRKNWSSVILWNCGHPSNRRLTVDLVNERRGRDLHRFCWLDDQEIGALDPRWNVLVGVEEVDDPAIAHFTEGTPEMPGYEDGPFADEWRAVATRAGYRRFTVQAAP